MSEGMTVLANKLFGDGGKSNKESLDLASSKKIISIEVANDELLIGLPDGLILAIWDAGQSCCEYRYLHTDDDLLYFVGAEFVGIEEKEWKQEYTKYHDVHEIMFVDVITSKGVFTLETHNEHNGYYGGFLVKCEIRKT
jgi:hypothetical protein